MQLAVLPLRFEFRRVVFAAISHLDLSRAGFLDIHLEARAGNTADEVDSGAIGSDRGRASDLRVGGDLRDGGGNGG